MENKPFIIDCGAYPNQVMVYIGDNKKPLIKELKKTLPKEELEYIKTVQYSKGDCMLLSEGRIVLTLNENKDQIEFLGTLAHEIFHCASLVMRHVGIKHNKHTEESYAYLVDYITRQILTKLFILSP